MALKFVIRIFFTIEMNETFKVKTFEKAHGQRPESPDRHPKRNALSKKEISFEAISKKSWIRFPYQEIFLELFFKIIKSDSYPIRIWFPEILFPEGCPLSRGEFLQKWISRKIDILACRKSPLYFINSWILIFDA